MAYKGFPKAMWIAGAVLLAVIIAEAVYVFSVGLEKTATVADEGPVVETEVEPIIVEDTIHLEFPAQPADE